MSLSAWRVQRPLHNIFHKALVARAYASTTSTYVPTAQLNDISDAPPANRGGRGRDEKPRPNTPSFYTTRPEYYDQLAQIEAAIKSSRKALTSLQLLPLPDFANQFIPPATMAWKDKTEMSNQFGLKLTTTRYRKITGLLAELDLYKRVAQTAERGDLSQTIGSIISLFESGSQRAKLEERMKQQLNKRTLDQFGRSYTVGKRKTSAARVWIIPTKQVHATPKQAPASTSNPESEALESMFGDAAAPAAPAQAAPLAVQPTAVLVNNIPLAEYFPSPADRERIIRPFKLAGVLGGYNVFSIVRGGGTSGQSGAVAHGIAKGLVIHEPSAEEVLRTAKLLRRDPRMVERKKTGFAKARKRYTWVKR